jgi:Xaa-Pro aminopeptidase
VHETRLELPGRRARLPALLEQEGVDGAFLQPSSDLEYLTGLERDPPSFGAVRYAHDWVTGAFVAPGREPLFVLPRMVLAFHLGDAAPGETIVVAETDDGTEWFAGAVASASSVASVSTHVSGRARCSRCSRRSRVRSSSTSSRSSTGCGASSRIWS